MAVFDPVAHKADLERRMHSAVEALKSDLGGLRTGRASTSLLDRVTVEVYGSNMAPEPGRHCHRARTADAVVQVWDKSNVQMVDKAIRAAGLGLNPIVDGQTLRLAHSRPDRGPPQGTGQARVAIFGEGEDRGAQRPPGRHGRPEGAEKKGDLSQDEQKKFESEVQKITDKITAEMDAASGAKEKEILGK